MAVNVCDQSATGSVTALREGVERRWGSGRTLGADGGWERRSWEEGAVRRGEGAEEGEAGHGCSSAQRSG